MRHFQPQFDVPEPKRVPMAALPERRSRLGPMVIPSAFATTLADAQECVLLLAYDAIVAPFARDQLNACPYPGMPQLLERIIKTCGTRIALISGRAAHDVSRLLGTSFKPEIWGSYGLERLHSDGRKEMPDIRGDILESLDKVAAELESFGLAPLAENKPGAVAVRWSSLPSNKLEEAKAIAYRVMSPATRNPALKLELFDGGLELRLSVRKKSDAVRTILSEIDARVPVAYLGHDVTDEDVFRALSGRGLSLLVTSKSRFSAAQLWLKPPDDLIRFLGDWMAACAVKS